MGDFSNFLLDNRIKKKEIAEYLGVSSAFVTQICSGARSLPKDKLDKIKANKAWDSSMLEEEVETIVRLGDFSNYYVPVLPVSARAGRIDGYSVGVKPSDCEYAVSPIAGADMIIPVSGESMAPEYPNGSRIVVKKVNERAFLEWGKVYVLDTVNGAVLKELRKTENDDELLCVSLNPDPKYAPFVVHREDVLGVYRVLMCMTLK